MTITLNEIINLLKDNFSSIELIESESASNARYNESSIVLLKSNYKNQKVALKCFIDNGVEKGSNLIKAVKENEYLRAFGGVPGIVNVYDLLKINGEEDNDVLGYVLVEDYFPDTLGNYIKNGNVFTHRQIISFLKQMDTTLRTLHFNSRKPLIHCDIKPSNIGIRRNGGMFEFILFDFDIALESNGDKEVSFVKLLGLTPEYSAPEVLKGINSQHNNYTISSKVDVYSIGVIALQLARKKSILSQRNIAAECNLLKLKLRQIICPLLEVDKDKRSAFVLQNYNKWRFLNGFEGVRFLVVILLMLLTLLLGLFMIIFIMTIA